MSHTITLNGVLVPLVFDTDATHRPLEAVYGRVCRTHGLAVEHYQGEFFCNNGCGDIDEADVVRREEADVE